VAACFMLKCEACLTMQQDRTDLQDGVLVLQAGDLVLLGLHLLRQAVERLLQLLEAQLAPLPAPTIVEQCSTLETTRRPLVCSVGDTLCSGRPIVSAFGLQTSPQPHVMQDTRHSPPVSLLRLLVLQLLLWIPLGFLMI
jgi:hypothetical protein